MQQKALRLLTTEEAATMLGVQAQTLAVWRCKHRNGDLKYVQLGRLIRYREIDVLDFIDRRIKGHV